LLALRMQAQTTPAPSAGATSASGSKGASATSASKPAADKSDGPKWYERWFK
jgi:hypothetical protein